jgi:predicted Zn-dependent protease
MLRMTGIRLLLLAGLLALSHGCAVNPVTGRNEVAFVAPSQELEIGQKNYLPYRQAQGGDYVVDAELTRYVQTVGQRLAAVSDRDLPYEFVVVNDSTPNAWALPGGKIAINRGLLVELDSEAELAAVLAHEIVHAAARHSAQSIERGVFLQGALIAAGVALSGSEYRELGLVGAGVGAQLVNQKYGRDDESEADHYGIRYMVRAGYDPAAAVHLQETFVRLAEGRASSWLEGLFASHPPSRERVRANRRLVEELGAPGGEIGRERYQRAIARLKRTEPAYAAYDEAREALADDKLSSALRLVDKAIAIEPDEAAFYTLRGEIRERRGDEAGALSDLDRAVALNPDHYRPLLARGMLRRAAGDLAGAQRDLERSAAFLPTAEAYYDLGLVARDRQDSQRAVSYLRRAAESRSSAGRQAQRQLALLDLQDNPSRYLAARLGLSRDGFLTLEVENRSAVAVSDVEVAIGQRGAGGLRPARRIELGRALAPGATGRIATGIGPVDSRSARTLGAVVTRARVTP